jgi:hypothetical protein
MLISRRMQKVMIWLLANMWRMNGPRMDWFYLLLEDLAPFLACLIQAIQAVKTLAVTKISEPRMKIALRLGQALVKAVNLANQARTAIHLEIS